jgi:hypothetical protein
MSFDFILFLETHYTIFIGDYKQRHSLVGSVFEISYLLVFLFLATGFLATGAFLAFVFAILF